VRYTLRKHEIIRGRGTFSKIFSSGSKLAEETLICFYQIEKDDVKTSKVLVGFSINKKNGGAIVRNRIKRLMRESYRLNKHILLDALMQNKFIVSIIFLYRKNISCKPSDIKFEIINKETGSLLNRLKYILLLKETT
jgi:ribonuclease P protein component